jgi:hypothetical protein
MMRVFIVIGSLAAILGILGCSVKVSTTAGNAPINGAAYVLTSQPANALPVGDARKQVSDNEEVTVVGRIGGSLEPFVDGMAAFTIVDLAVPYCAEEETPWTYCCHQDAVKDNIATVQIVDETDNTIMTDARSLCDIKEFSTVTVQGKAKRDPQGNLALHATKLFVNAK